MTRGRRSTGFWLDDPPPVPAAVVDRVWVPLGGVRPDGVTCNRIPGQWWPPGTPSASRVQPQAAETAAGVVPGTPATSEPAESP